MGPASGAAAAPDYEAEVRRHFAGVSAHPAVAWVKRLQAADPSGTLPAEILLRLSPPPGLLRQRPLPEGYERAAGGAAQVEAFLVELRDYCRRSGCAAFFAAHQSLYDSFARTARAEALQALSLSAVSGYLGHVFTGRVRFVPAVLLAERDAVNISLSQSSGVEEVRLRAGSAGAGAPRFMFDAFGSSVGHELIHTVTNGLVPALAAGGAPPGGCNDQGGASWSSCFQEHLVYAVTLRLLALDLGEEVGRQTLQRYAGRGFPFLEAVCERLKEYERDRVRYPTLKDFYPRLEKIFLETVPQGAAPRPQDKEVQSLKDSAVKEFLAGHAAKAEKTLLSALKLAPDDAEALMDLAVVMETSGRTKEALGYFARAAEAGGAGAGCRRAWPRGTLLERLGRSTRPAGFEKRCCWRRAAGRASGRRRHQDLVKPTSAMGVKRASALVLSGAGAAVGGAGARRLTFASPSTPHRAAGVINTWRACAGLARRRILLADIEAGFGALRGHPAVELTPPVALRQGRRATASSCSTTTIRPP